MAKQGVLFFFSLLIVCSLSAQAQYFPSHAFCREDETEHCERWYVPHLRAMNEPSLWELSKSQTAESYRFLWLRTFNRPVSARLTVAKDGSGELSIKVLSGSGGYKPGYLIQDRSTKVAKDSVDHFLQLLGKANFWSAPTEETENGTVGLDGAQWIIEATREGRYHVVDRWSPQEGPYREAALFLAINLGGLNPRYNDVY
jgi:hypothetical protein